MKTLVYILFFLWGCTTEKPVQKKFSALNTIDERVSYFLKSRRNSWRNLNVPYVDGKVLYDLIVKNNFKSALDIGTSTGHSSIWMAWALSKTGGKLITIEINKDRHLKALKNFKHAGVLTLIDARLGDAHDIVPSLKGPFDFVFSDADKGWYKQYFLDVDLKLNKQGCFLAHNVTDNFWDSKAFLKFLRGLKNYQTVVDRSSRSGISISCKKENL